MDFDLAGCKGACVTWDAYWHHLAIAIEPRLHAGLLGGYLSAVSGINIIIVREIFVFLKRNISACTLATPALADLRACWRHVPGS